MRFIALGLVCATAGFAANTGSTQVTYYKDVLPVLQKNCQNCHRPGEAGPMSFMSYESTRPWAKAIKAAVLTKKMPPWYADPHYGKFSNDRTMAQNDINTLIAWVDTGAKPGNAKDAPAPSNSPRAGQFRSLTWSSKCRLDFDIPASGTDRLSVHRDPDELHRRQVRAVRRGAAAATASASTTSSRSSASPGIPW